MDEETALLISQIHLDDLQELTSKAKGKQRAGEMDDLQFAVNCYEAELQAFQLLLKDKEISSSMARAVFEDAPLLAEFKAQEDQAAQDRSLALRWRDDNTHRPPTTTTTTTDDVESQQSDDELVQKLAALYMFGPDLVGQDDEAHDDDSHDPGSQPESSSWAATRPSTTAATSSSSSSSRLRRTDKRQCIICLNENVPFYNVLRAPCSHDYCRHCLMELFTRALTDESLFPPRCCGQPIPINQASRLFLPTQLVGAFQAKKVERETPNPTYCHRPNCSTFIPLPFVQGEVGTCVRCRAATCTICKGASHSGDCPEDTTTQEVLRIAAENEWQRCPSCRRVVELHTGCHHITCLCRAQFCYVCAAPWKSCPCPQWREDRLVERAGAVVDRLNHGDRPRPMPAEERAERVAQVAQQLVDDHECAHHRWGRIGGPRQCEECGDEMPIWLNVCRQCHVMVCRRCRYNRL